MLSLRDTGKIRRNNESILQLSRSCGFPQHTSFSLKDFIRKNCLVDVTRLKLCVVLIMWSPPKSDEPKFDKKEKSWYENYFLNIGYPNGIASYWFKESFGKLKIEGKVLDWTLKHYDPKFVLDKDAKGKTLNTINRTTALDIAQRIAIENNETIADYDGFIAVFAVGSDYIVNGDNSGTGATFGIGINHNHTCHEVGHIIGNINGLFTHSFGLETKDLRGGVYGYPYCIMSAEWYGGAYEYFTPPTALNPEEGKRGPGLCGGTRAFLKWANSVTHNLDNGNEAEFVIQSLGSNQPNTQVVLIKKGPKVFFVEYRSSKDNNDTAISKLGFDAIVVVGIVTGGIAAGEKDGRHTTNATFIGQIPVNFSAASITNEIVNFEPNWGIKLLRVNANSTVNIKVIKNFSFSLKTFRRTHDIPFSDGSSSFQIDGSPDYEAKCNLYDNLRQWRFNNKPLKNFRSLVIL